MPITSSPPTLAHSVPTIVEMTGYSKAFVYKLIADGNLPAVKIGRSVRVMHDDLVEFLEAHRTGVNA